MLELLATIQQDILSFFPNGRAEKSILRERPFHRVLTRHIPVQRRFKILLPYSTDELVYSLLEMNRMLDLVCLSPIDATIVNNEKGHRVFFPDKNLRLFRDKADFDLVFCTLMNFQGETDRLCEDFCQCRMLLKPGGKFFLHVKNDKAKSFMEIFMLKKGGVAAGILSRVGLSNIVERRLPHGQLLSFGQRPFSNF